MRLIQEVLDNFKRFAGPRLPFIMGVAAVAAMGSSIAAIQYSQTLPPSWPATLLSTYGFLQIPVSVILGAEAFRVAKNRKENKGKKHHPKPKE